MEALLNGFKYFFENYFSPFVMDIAWYVNIFFIIYGFGGICYWIYIMAKEKETTH